MVAVVVRKRHSVEIYCPRCRFRVGVFRHGVWRWRLDFCYNCSLEQSYPDPVGILKRWGGRVGGGRE